MTEITTTLSRAASPAAESDIEIGAIEVGALFAERHRLLKSRGLRLDCRAKCASGRVLHWARLIESSGREMASSGGWYETEDGAVQQALAMLQLIDALPLE